mmetsp:Transcript_32297/g.75861  ORF Transcript_32297/g.75861 Transcript_32297/m.75861 type:complete len:536 (-) Transcript_32297:165-1772(-)|eukprot:CAMPEP_0178441814 /NCGR_PEP_ID=MMETSP0689_2-20121128/37727_1 /TAXON_ID=160604 /ORGANISM="Amphidinium massartii, Strain CS-259" /LENGTH=535 /DNA_ID=CAMNT_0020065109 /DNA_START=80 /DNA_END=1687 /DNA_ORIENTATION=+
MADAQEVAKVDRQLGRLMNGGSPKVPISAAVAKTVAKQTVAELGHTARQTRDASAALFTWLRLDAERRLGFEMNVEDPAVLHLFECLLQVETLLQQALAQASALLEAAQHLAEANPASTSSVASAASGSAATQSVAAAFKGFLGGKVANATGSSSGSSNGSRATLARELADLAKRPLSSGQTTSEARTASVSACLDSVDLIKEAEWNTVQWSPNAGDGGSSRYRLERRLQEEVIEPVQRQLEANEELRQLLREQKTWKQTVQSSRREVVTVAKQERRSSEPSSADVLATDVRSPPSGARSASETTAGQYKVAQLKTTELDQEILAKLLKAKEDAVRTVARPWAAVGQIRKDFFAELAGQWGPAVTVVGAPDEQSRKERARALAAARAEAARAAAEASKQVVGARSDWPGPDNTQPVVGAPSDESEAEDDEMELPRLDEGAVFNSAKEEGTLGGSQELQPAKSDGGEVKLSVGCSDGQVQEEEEEAHAPTFTGQAEESPREVDKGAVEANDQSQGEAANDKPQDTAALAEDDVDFE